MTAFRNPNQIELRKLLTCRLETNSVASEKDAAAAASYCIVNQLCLQSALARVMQKLFFLLNLSSFCLLSVVEEVVGEVNQVLQFIFMPNLIICNLKLHSIIFIDDLFWCSANNLEVIGVYFVD